MHRGRNTRLNRLIRRAAAGDGAAVVEHRRLLAARAAIGAAVRWSLARQGIDPALASGLRVADEAAAELAASGAPSPSSSGRPACDGDPPTDLGFSLDDGIDRLVARYRGRAGEAPDFARASLAELLAWCIAVADRPDAV